MGRVVEGQEKAEGEETVDRDGSNPSITGEMLHHTRRVEAFVAGRNHRDGRTCTRSETCIRRVHV